MWLALREYDNDNNKIGENVTGLVAMVMTGDDGGGGMGGGHVDGNQINASEKVVIGHARDSLAVLHECAFVTRLRVPAFRVNC